MQLAQLEQELSLAPRVVQLPSDRHALVEQGYGLAGPSRLAGLHAQVEDDDRQIAAGPKPLHQPPRLLKGRVCLLVPCLLLVDPPEGDAGIGLAAEIADGPGQLQGLLGVVHRQLERRWAQMASDPALQGGKGVQGLGLTAVVVEILEDGKGAGEHGLAPGEADRGMARLAQVAAAGAEDGGLAAAVAGLLAGGQGTRLERVGPARAGV